VDFEFNAIVTEDAEDVGGFDLLGATIPM